MGAMKKEDIARVTWLQSPHLVVYYFAIVVKEGIASFLYQIVHHWNVSALIGAIAAAFYAFIQNPPDGSTQLRDLIAEEGSFALYWVILGVLSSIGLGSGLHTFLLFLMPHIIRVANTAVSIGGTQFSARIISYFNWAGQWDVAGLSQAFSPLYADDAWDLPSYAADAAAAAASGASGCGHADALASLTQPSTAGCGDSGANDGYSPFLAIVFKVAWPCFLWGLGTSLGELPPYFIARAAARAGEALEELEEVEELEAEMTLEDIESAENGSSAGKDMLLNAAKNGEELLESLLFGGGGGDEDGSITPSGITSGWSAKPAGGRHSQGVSGAGKGDKASKKKEHHHVGLVERAKVAVFESIQRYGFWAILAAASIPNPLFDLAGLTCGHFGISFWTFFGATFIGKAIVKVGIQALFIIALCVHGPIAFAWIRSSLPDSGILGMLRKGLSDYESRWVHDQHVMCTKEVGLEGCSACCARLHRSSFDQCTASCTNHAMASGGAGSASGAAVGAAPSEGLFKQAWGYILTAMILYFVGSIITSLVHEYLVRQLTLAAEAGRVAQGSGSGGGSQTPRSVSSVAAASEAGAGAAASSAARPGSRSTVKLLAPPPTPAPVVAAAAAPSGRKPRGGSVGASASAAAITHQAHIHGANLISALVNSPDLRVPSPASSAAAAGFSGKKQAGGKSAAALADENGTSSSKSFVGALASALHLAPTAAAAPAETKKPRGKRASSKAAPIETESAPAAAAGGRRRKAIAAAEDDDESLADSAGGRATTARRSSSRAAKASPSRDRPASTTRRR